MSERAVRPNASDPTPTSTLVDQAALGNERALQALCERLRPRLVAWAHGRLPRYARELLNTEDLIQDTMVRSLKRLGTFEDRGGDSFLRYMRTAILNTIRNEIRRIGRLPGRGVLHDNLKGNDKTPLENLLTREDEARYQEALACLSPDAQDLVIGRIELLMTPHELALHTGRPSPDAARMAARRAIAKLAHLIEEDGNRNGGTSK